LSEIKFASKVHLSAFHHLLLFHTCEWEKERIHNTGANEPCHHLHIAVAAASAAAQAEFVPRSVYYCYYYYICGQVEKL